MKSKYYETEQFKRLNAEWQRKLKSSGFVDLEEGIPAYTQLPALNHKTHRSKDSPAVAAHFQAAFNYLGSGKFDNFMQKRIWEYYCNGATERLIADRMFISRSAVHSHIVKVRERMSSGN